MYHPIIFKTIDEKKEIRLMANFLFSFLLCALILIGTSRAASTADLSADNRMDYKNRGDGDNG